jgi:hypothetical protein
MNNFHTNLNNAYEAIETKFNQFRNNYAKKHTEELSNKITPVEVPKEWLPRPAERVFIHGNSRATINLNNGYVVKVRPERNKEIDYIEFITKLSQVAAFQEETNVVTLRENGFTKENGFYVPNHKVIGLQNIEGIIKIDTEGKGLTISEDISENGKYLVKDIDPIMFYQLDNKEEFLSEYKRHLDALLQLYYNPNIYATINRHGKPNNPLEPISRMLLSKIKDNKGQIIIGDLDNIMFE